MSFLAISWVEESLGAVYDAKNSSSKVLRRAFKVSKAADSYFWIAVWPTTLFSDGLSSVPNEPPKSTLWLVLRSTTKSSLISSANFLGVTSSPWTIGVSCATPVSHAIPGKGK